MLFDDDEWQDLERAGFTLVEGVLVLIGVGFFCAVLLLWY